MFCVTELELSFLYIISSYSHKDPIKSGIDFIEKSREVKYLDLHFLAFRHDSSLLSLSNQERIKLCSFALFKEITK